MKIGILQPDVTRIGGSISTTLQFADCFKELGHTVKIHSSFNGRFQIKLIDKKEKVLEYYDCKHLTMEDFIWDLRISNNYDLCFTRKILQPNVSHVKNIIWAILPNEVKSNNNLIEFWTNSKTTKSKMNKNFQKKVVIVPAPHDYSVFRKNIQKEKKYDIVSILRGNDFNQKGIPLYAKMVKKLKRKSLLITTYTNDNDLKKIKKLRVPYVLNKTRTQIAKILGQSKFFFFPSYNESCPLVIYEAMNSGLTIVSRDVGAVIEQLDGNGYIFENDDGAYKKLNYALDNPLDCDTIIKRGMFFDRKNLLSLIEKRLKNVKK